VILESLTFIFLARVAIYDIKTYLIRNLDIFLLLIFLTPKIANRWEFGLINLVIYLLINILAKGKIGAGDIKLSVISGLMLDTYLQLFNALSYTWIIGGIYALLMGSKTIAFAPFMICGTYLAKIF
jgi:Flp pilus assembly protein protease CpaA